MASTITFAVSPTDSGTADGSVTDYRGGPLEEKLPGTYAMPNATAATGWYFDHWELSPGGYTWHSGSEKSTSPTANYTGYDLDITATAHFKPADHGILCNKSGTILCNSDGIPLCI